MSSNPEIVEVRVADDIEKRDEISKQKTKHNKNYNWKIHAGNGMELTYSRGRQKRVGNH